MDKLTTDQKTKIREGALAYAARFGTRNQCANALKINVAQFSEAITSGKLDGVLSDAKWIDIAQTIGISLNDGPEWKIAQTKVLIYLTEQFDICQRESISGLFCDVCDCGKTTAAKYYVSTHKNAIRVDCSIFKSKRRLVGEIARQFGVARKNSHWDMLDGLIWTLNHAQNPLVILDEFGDLQYDAMLEVKALWNSTENHCAWFLMGADALRAKIERGQTMDRVGFAELFSRTGGRYQSCIAKDAEARKQDLVTQAALVGKLNAPDGMNIQKMISSNGFSLRRIYHEITKANSINGTK